MKLPLALPKNVLRGTAISSASPLHPAVFSMNLWCQQAKKDKLILMLLLFYTNYMHKVPSCRTDKQSTHQLGSSTIPSAAISLPSLFPVLAEDGRTSKSPNSPNPVHYFFSSGYTANTKHQPVLGLPWASPCLLPAPRGLSSLPAFGSGTAPQSPSVAQHAHQCSQGPKYLHRAGQPTSNSASPRRAARTVSHHCCRRHQRLCSQREPCEAATGNRS